MEDYFKSIKSVLYDRATSPFYGTLIISWLIWNWKIPYVTFFVSEECIGYSKIDFIIKCLNTNNSIIYPIISTAIIIFIVPLLTNGTFWISHKYDIWRNNKKNELDKKVLLTIEQSIELRREIENVNIEFGKIVNTKDEEIRKVKQINEGLIQQFANKEQEYNKISEDNIKLNERLLEREEVISKQNEELAELRLLEMKFNINTIKDFLDGVWNNYHTYPNNKSFNEEFEIKNGNEYYINNELTFRLENIEVYLSETKNQISFDKVDVKNSSRKFSDKLSIINENKLEGVENDNIIIVYTRKNIRDNNTNENSYN